MTTLRPFVFYICSSKESVGGLKLLAPRVFSAMNEGECMACELDLFGDNLACPHCRMVLCPGCLFLHQLRAKLEVDLGSPHPDLRIPGLRRSEVLCPGTSRGRARVFGVRVFVPKWHALPHPDYGFLRAAEVAARLALVKSVPVTAAEHIAAFLLWPPLP